MQKKEEKKKGRPFIYTEGKKVFSIRLTEDERTMIQNKFGSVQKMVEEQIKKLLRKFRGSS